MYRCLSCNRSCGISWEGIAFFQSCFVSLCPRGNSDVIDMILWSHPVWKLPSEFKSTWSSAGNACTSKKKYMNFAYIFDNIRFFFGWTVASSDIRSMLLKYWENLIFLSYFMVFLFACMFWQNSFVLNLSDTSDIFVSTQHIFLSDTSTCCYPRIVLIRGPMLLWHLFVQFSLALFWWHLLWEHNCWFYNIACLIIFNTMSYFLTVPNFVHAWTVMQEHWIMLSGSFAKHFCYVLLLYNFAWPCAV